MVDMVGTHCPTCGRPTLSVGSVNDLAQVTAYLLDAMKYHLRGSEGFDQRSLDHALATFERAFLKNSRSE